MRFAARHSREWLISIGCVVVVVAGLALANADVRRDLAAARRSIDRGHVAALTSGGGAMADEATGWVRAILVSQAPLVVFGCASLVLVYLMLRL